MHLTHLLQNLLKDKEGADAEWIPELKGLEVIQAIDIPPDLEPEMASAAAVWISRLALPMPLQDRTFLCLVLTTSTPDEFWNVSIPFAHDAYPPGRNRESGRTRGTYVSVERVRKLPSGKVEWLVLTSFSRTSLSTLLRPSLDQKLMGVWLPLSLLPLSRRQRHPAADRQPQDVVQARRRRRPLSQLGQQ